MDAQAVRDEERRQQAAELKATKEANNLHTLKTRDPNFDDNGAMEWLCWDGPVDPADFLSDYGMDAFGFGSTESAAVNNYLSIDRKE